MPDAEFFRDIGRKGGQAGKGSEAKRRSAQAAANARWKKNRMRPVKLTVDGGNVYLSREVQGLKKALGAHVGKRNKGIIKWEESSLLIKNDGEVFAPTTLLHRVTAFLKGQGITWKMVWKTKPFHQRLGLMLHGSFKDYTYRQQRVLKSVLNQPAGALCRSSLEGWDWLLVEILRVTSPARAILVVEEIERLWHLHSHLQQELAEIIGVLTDQAHEAQLDEQRIIIMTPAYVDQHIIPVDECEILIFDRCPRTGFTQVQAAGLAFPSAWRMARLDDARRGHWRMLMAEAAFGEVVEVSSALRIQP